MPTLQPLDLHSNWKVIMNEFYDIEPTQSNFESELRFYFMEDILEIKNKVNNTFIHLGWYPEFDPEGSYKIFVFDTDFEGKLLTEFESKSKKETAEELTSIIKKYT